MPNYSEKRGRTPSSLTGVEAQVHHIEIKLSAATQVTSDHCGHMIVN
jgi:hypothetical protein